MRIELDLVISSVEEKELSSILGCTTEELGEQIKPYIKAASAEYISMFLGQKVFGRVSDFKEYRLFLLIQEVFKTIPDEQQVSMLFQTTSSESRTLIRSVTSKYQYLLSKNMISSIETLLGKIEPNPEKNGYIVTINSSTMVDELNKVLARIDGKSAQIVKRPGTVSTYDISPGSKKILENYLKELRK